MSHNQLSRKKAAELLMITEDSLKNWEQQKKIISKNNFFLQSDVEKLKASLIEGSIPRLKNRANKLYSKKNIIPTEIIESKIDLDKIQLIVKKALAATLKMEEIIFLICIKSLTHSREILTDTLDKILNFKQTHFARLNVYTILRDFFQSHSFSQTEAYDSFYSDLPKNLEFKYIAPIYQCLLFEGKKSSTGSYYTPTPVINEMINNHITENKTILDPCCGTGQFLESFAKYIKSPDQIHGYDTDEIAIFIARLLMLNLFPDQDFKPNIFHRNFLEWPAQSNFDLIATNPPWGYRFTAAEKNQLEKKYPEIKTKESFSFFIIESLHHLKTNGVLSILLPEAISNSISHSDIRKHILKNKILRITHFGKKFSNVFTNVISLEIQKSKTSSTHRITNKTTKSEFFITQNSLIQSPHFIFSIYMEPEARKIRDKVFSIPHRTLKNGADWALGIVTGNNKACLTPIASSTNEAVFKGTDVQAYRLSSPTHYLSLENHHFQQIAPIEKYRSKEKLIYRFISNKLIIAYDNKKSLTLNSANIVIPAPEHFSLLLILALFNSSLYQFIYQKSFHSLKVIRTYLEMLPIPRITPDRLKQIETQARKIINQEAQVASMDSLIYSLFNLNAHEIAYIEANIK